MCGAPVVVIAGGEPLLHKDLPQIVEGIIAQKKFAIVCTNALLLEKKIAQYKPSPYFTWSIHLDGDKEMHDQSVCQRGVYDKAVAAIQKAKEMGFRVTINCTFFNNSSADKIADFFDSVTRNGHRRHHRLPRLRLRARPRPAALPQPPGDQGPVPPACSASQGEGPRRSGPSSSRACSSTSWPATRPTTAPVGQPDPDGLRLAEAVLPARRRLRQDLQGADGDHGLGFLRHGQLREVRRLHGAFRLRGLLGGRLGEEAVEAGDLCAARDQDRGRDGSRDLPREPAPAPSSCSHATSRRSSPRSGTPRPTPRSARQRPNAAKAADESRARRTSPPTLARRRASAARTARMSGSPSGLRALAIAARKGAVGRVAQHPHGAERQPVRLREGGRDVGFHVDRRRPGLRPQGRLGVRRQHRRLHPRDIGEHHPHRRVREPAGEGRDDLRVRRVPDAPALTPVATTTSPGTRSGASPPAMPMLITARQPGAARPLSISRSRSGLPPAPTVATPGPAASRASRARPVTASTGWGPRGPVVSSTTVMPWGARGTLWGGGSGSPIPERGEASMWRR